jgi:heterotetrameric sarcosine oxidase gamma subunit
MADRAHPLTALAAASPDCASVRLTACPAATRVIVRGDAASVGLAVPAVCRATVHSDRALLWLGPDEFLLLAPADWPDTASVVQRAWTIDISHRDTALEVSGPRAAWAINAFCALDLHRGAFPVGMCTRTLFGKAQIVLWRQLEHRFRIEVARSFAAYVWACLEEARREFLA